MTAVIIQFPKRQTPIPVANFIALDERTEWLRRRLQSNNEPDALALVRVFSEIHDAKY